MKNLKIFVVIFFISLMANVKPQKPINKDELLLMFEQNPNIECVVIPGGIYPIPILSSLITSFVQEIKLCGIITKLVQKSTNLNLNIQQTHPEGIPSNLTQFQLLLLEKLPENTTFEGWTPLMWATRCRRVKIVKKLIKFGADTYIQSSNELTAKIIAECMGYEELVDLLD